MHIGPCQCYFLWSQKGLEMLGACTCAHLYSTYMYTCVHGLKFELHWSRTILFRVGTHPVLTWLLTEPDTISELGCLLLSSICSLAMDWVLGQELHIIWNGIGLEFKHMCGIPKLRGLISTQKSLYGQRSELLTVTPTWYVSKCKHWLRQSHKQVEQPRKKRKKKEKSTHPETSVL